MNWRGPAWKAYLSAARPFVRLGLTRLPLGRKTLGKRVDERLRRVFAAGLSETQLIHGVRFHYQLSNGERHVEYVVRDYERETRQLFEAVVRPGMTVVDVGAHIGYITLLAAVRVGSTGRVYAFEPDPLNFELLCRNVRENALDGIVTPVQNAVTYHTGKVTVYRGRTGTNFNSILHSSSAGTETVEAHSDSLDSFFEARDWPVVHVLKMDIEGAETEALRGAAQLIGRNPQLKLIVEFNPVCQRVAGVTASDFLRLLRDLGFRSVRVIGADGASSLSEEATPTSLDTWLGEAVNLVCER
jgi:FkbM family methyltransferase